MWKLKQHIGSCKKVAEQFGFFSFFFPVLVKLFQWKQLINFHNKWKNGNPEGMTFCIYRHITRNLSPRNESRFVGRKGCAAASFMSSMQFLKQRMWWFPREIAQPQCLSIFKDYHSGLLNPTLFPLIHRAAGPISRWQACSLFNNRKLIKY